MAGKMGDREFEGDNVYKAYRQAGKDQAEMAKGIANVAGNTIGAPYKAMYDTVKNAAKNGLPYAAGQAYRDSVNKMSQGIETGANLSRQAFDTMASTAGFVGDKAEKGIDAATGVAVEVGTDVSKGFKKGAGIPVEEEATHPKVIDPSLADENVNSEFDAAEKQLKGLDSAQLAPTSADPKPLPAGISQLDINGNEIFKNDQLSAEDQKKYGKAIYSDSALGATTQGFDDAKGISSVIETSNDPYGDHEDPRTQAMNLLKTMPYGTPGDRQKRQSIVAHAQMLLGIGQQDFNQLDSNRQYGLDAYKAFNPNANQVGRYKGITGSDIYDEHGNKIGQNPNTIFDSVTGQPVNQQTKQQTRAPELQAIVDEFLQGEDTPSRREMFDKRYTELENQLEGK